MVAALWALRLFEDVPELSTKWRMNISETGGFSSAWVCPFAARVYVEKLSCDYHSVQVWPYPIYCCLILFAEEYYIQPAGYDGPSTQQEARR